MGFALRLLKNETFSIYLLAIQKNILILLKNQHISIAVPNHCANILVGQFFFLPFLTYSNVVLYYRHTFFCDPFMTARKTFPHFAPLDDVEVNRGKMQI